MTLRSEFLPAKNNFRIIIEMQRALHTAAACKIHYINCNIWFEDLSQAQKDAVSINIRNFMQATAMCWTYCVICSIQLPVSLNIFIYIYRCQHKVLFYVIFYSI